MTEAGERDLRAKLRKIEALFAGAGTEGERLAAGAAIERIVARLREAERRAPPIEMQFLLKNDWSRKLFVALCRRYGLRPYRLPRQRTTTVMVKVAKSFVDEVLWPEFTELNRLLVDYLGEVTEEIIRSEVHRETSEAAEGRG
jgi:hypothetical protein